MPTVSRPYVPDFYDPNLIAWYDASKSNTVVPPLAPGGQISPLITQVVDAGTQKNTITANTNIVYANFSNTADRLALGFTYSNFFGIYDAQVLQNPAITLKYRPSGVTVFLVLAPGYGVLGNNILSLFGTSYLNIDLNTIDINNSIPPIATLGTTVHTALVGVDYNNYAYATNDSNVGPRILQRNSNITRILSATFDGTNATVRLNGVSSTSPCALPMVNGSGPYILQVGDSNFGGPSGGILDTRNSSNGAPSYPYLQEVRVYSSAMPLVNIVTLEQQLAAKWRIQYPIASNTNPLLGIDNLLLWLDSTSSSNFTFTGTDPYGSNFNVVYSSESLNNSNMRYGSYSPSWNSKYIYFVKDRALYNNWFQGTGIVQGLTVSLVLKTTKFDNTSFTSYSNGNILNLYTPSNINTLNTTNYPCVLNDLNGNLFLGNRQHGLDGNGLPIGLGIDGQDSVVVTAQIYRNNRYQLFVNGWPMAMQTLTGSFNMPLYVATADNTNFIGGSPDITDIGNIIGSSAQIGEIVVYKKILSSTELASVHNRLLNDYTISSNVPITGLLGWFDATSSFGYSETAYSITNWDTIRGSISTTSDVSGIPIVRSWSNLYTNTYVTGVDFNNGLPSFLAATGLNSTITDFSIFIVCTKNGSIGDPGCILDLYKSTGPGNTNCSISVTNSNVFSMDSNFTTTASVAPSPLYIVHCESVNGSAQNIYAIPSTGRTQANPNYPKTLNTLTLGGIRNIPAYGRNSIFETLIYNRLMTNNETAIIYSYLQSKYSFPMPYYAAPDSISDLFLWYDTNDLYGTTGSLFPSKNSGSYGPTLSNTSASPSLQLINGNRYANIANDSNVYRTIEGLDCEVIPDSYGYTLFMITQGIGIGSLFSLYSGMDPIATRATQPNIYIRTDKIEIGVGSNRTIQQDSYSLIKSNATDYLTTALLTCVTHSSNTGLTTVQTKGTFSEYKSTTDAIMVFQAPNNTVVLGASYIDDTGTPIERLTGNIGEVILYNRGLNDVEKLNVFNYLENKWINGNGPFSSNR